MKKFVLMLLAVVATSQLWAQPEGENRMQEMIDRQTERLVKSFKLSDEAATSFKETFKAYQTEMFATRGENREQGRGEERTDEKKEMTDEEATAKLQENFQRQEQQLQSMQQRLEVQKKYYEEFKKVLTPNQIYRIMVPQRNNRQGQHMQNNQRGQGGMRGGFGGPHGGFGGPGGGPF
ncbi:MAG: hypothetical protein HUK03_02270 [Bacteroidaceae bacterium]|nr:hypothetical protein [Bacteroidaceae bacterium]